jgi:hypothetical protein
MTKFGMLSGVAERSRIHGRFTVAHVFQAQGVVTLSPWAEIAARSWQMR